MYGLLVFGYVSKGIIVKFFLIKLNVFWEFGVYLNFVYFLVKLINGFVILEKFGINFL